MSYQQNLKYPPPPRGNIFWIYPWYGMVKDIFFIIINHILYTVFKRTFLKSDELIKKLVNYFPIKNAIFLDSGRSAILVAIKTLGLKPNDEVILSDFNCDSVINSIIQAGAKPVIVDTDRYGKLTDKQVKKYITPKTKVIILTNIYGILDKHLDIQKLADSKKITLINDLSQSLQPPGINPTFFNNRNLYIFSFAHEKHLFSIGGGALVSYNKKFIHKAKTIVKTTKRTKQLFEIVCKRIKYYFTLFVYSLNTDLAQKFSKLNLINNFKSHKDIDMTSDIEVITPTLMNNLQLAILVKKLFKQDYINKINVHNYNLLRKNIVTNKNIQTYPTSYEYVNPLYFTILIKDRYRLAKYLSMGKIPTVWNYIPLHLMPKYSKYLFGNYPNSNTLWKKVLSIPFRYPMSTENLSFVYQTINKYYED